MRIERLSPCLADRLGVSLAGYAVTRDLRVIGLGETEVEAVRDARRSCGGLLRPDDVVSGITDAARSRVMDWGAAVANLRIVRGLLCTRHEGLAIRAVTDWFDARIAA